MPFSNQKRFIRTDKGYPVEHPYRKRAKVVMGPSNPNTIAMDPKGRYLYVSNRMTHTSMNKTPSNHLGKVDVIDTTVGEIIFSFNSGLQATALDISPDGKTLISSGFLDQSLHIFDVQKLKIEYEDFLEKK